MSVIYQPCWLGSAPRGAVAGVRLAILLFLPSTALGYEVTIGIDAAFVHDSNLNKDPADEESADSIEPGATIDVEHKGDRLRYKLRYAGSYQEYDNQDEAGGAQHRLRLKSDFDIDPLTSIHFKNSFRDIRNQRLTQDDIRDGDTGQDVRDNRYKRNDLELMLHRDITRSWELEVSATHQFIDFNRNLTRSDSNSIGVGGRVLHRFSPRHRLGGGLSWVRQDFDGDDFRLDAEAEYLAADLVWIFDIGEQVQLLVNGGPAWIDTDEDATDFVQQTQFVGGRLEGELFRADILSCAFDSVTATGSASECDSTTPGAEPIPADDLGELQTFSLAGGEPLQDDDVAFFGGVALQARFSDWTVDLDLRRRQSPPSGDAIAAKLSLFRWELGYAPARANWNAYLAGSLERREAFSSNTAIDYTVISGPDEAAQRSQAFTTVRDSSDRRDDYTALLGVKKQFSRNLWGDIAVSFRRTERRVSGLEVETDTYFFVVNISYVFDTFRF